MANSMLDWPEASQTSPMSTSVKVTEFLPETVTVSGAVPGAKGGRSTRHLPVESAAAVAVVVARGDGDFFAGIGVAPDGDFHFLLEDHVIAEDGGHFDVGMRGKKSDEGERNDDGGKSSNAHSWKKSAGLIRG